MPVDWDGIRINILDTPGYADFVGELRAGLRAADAALFVVSAADGVDGATRLVWEECAAVGMPRAIVVTHLDAARADFDEMTAVCQEMLGGDDPDAVIPLYLPAARRTPAPTGTAPVTGLIGLLTQQLFDYGSGQRTERDPDEGQLPLDRGGQQPAHRGHHRARARTRPCMDRYLGGEDCDVKTLIEDLEKAVARGTFHPVLAAAPAADGARQGLGTVELLELITGGFPTPGGARVPAVTTPDGKPRPALDLRPGRPAGRRGRQDLLRPVRRPDLPRPRLLRHPAPGRDRARLRTRPGGPRATRTTTSTSGSAPCPRPSASSSAPSTAAIAGDLACVAKLGRAETGDTLSAKDHPLLMEPWAMPDPLLPVAIQAHSKADEDKLSQGLARLVAEDPTMRLEQNPDTHQLVLWCLGEAHADVALERLRVPLRRAGRHRRRTRCRCARRSPSQADGRGRHVKQSGGHGQFAICEIEVEPLPGGSGIEFVDKVVGGAVPRQFIPSVEKGVRAQAARGVAAGYPLVDVRVTLLDGKAHSVDSSDAAFQTAGALALRECRRPGAHPPAGAGRRGGGARSPDDYVGAVMSDLSGRRGRVLGTEQAGPGTHPGARRGAGDRDRPVRGRSAVAVARHRPVHPRLRPARADAATAGGAHSGGSRIRLPADVRNRRGGSTAPKGRGELRDQPWGHLPARRAWGSTRTRGLREGAPHPARERGGSADRPVSRGAAVATATLLSKMCADHGSWERLSWSAALTGSAPGAASQIRAEWGPSGRIRRSQQPSDVASDFTPGAQVPLAGIGRTDGGDPGACLRRVPRRRGQKAHRGQPRGELQEAAALAVRTQPGRGVLPRRPDPAARRRPASRSSSPSASNRRP